ncbi:MAG: uracil-DNA glycosylase [Candidatus Eisenbacteria sp.]|nr:uracil-DNA glycosylase [Candidatus Eisenbacteria bacterium]
MQEIDRLFRHLKKSPGVKSIFNPWYDRDPKHDRNTLASRIRRCNLRCFLEQRVGRARYLLVGEALGYQGGHFTGIAMTSERILLGGLQERGISPEVVFRGQHLRTSSPQLKPQGFTEPTATVVWGSITAAGRDPFEFVLWNILPWHPFERRRGMLSNRTPRQTEIATGWPAMTLMREIFPQAQVIAVGRKAAANLAALGMAHACVRHPAQAGAAQFRAQFRGIVGRSKAAPRYHRQQRATR